MNTDFLPIANGQCIDRSKIPLLIFEDFYIQTLSIMEHGGKIVQFFAYAENDTVKLVLVLRTDKLLIAETVAPKSYLSLTSSCEPFHLFEREIAEQYGIFPKDHPWLKMVRYHANFTNEPDVFENDYTRDIPGNYPYYEVLGQEIHQVAVGPVHAGVIEPGHFRFNCIGERVLHLEIQLGYQHRGIETMLPAIDFKRIPVMTESIAGDTAIGHSLCSAQAIEALCGLKPDKGAQIIRMIAMELERIANHVGDLGALSNDVAFLPPANYFGRMRGDFLNMSLLICGNRFGKGLVRPGGVRFAIGDDIRQELTKRIDELKPQVEHTINLLFSTSSVLSRFEGCGPVSLADARNLGLVGPAGRACGIGYDARRDFPIGHYKYLELPVKTFASGDVFARAKIRADEILQSIGIIRYLLDHPIKTQIVEEHNLGNRFNLKPRCLAFTINEAWRGEVSHCILTDSEGKILRYKIKDPSFHNWNGLAMALRNTGISDFPLNNKSFNLSYCGFDL